MVTGTTLSPLNDCSSVLLIHAQTLSIRTLDPLGVTQEFTMPAKSLIRNGELVGEAELRTAELGTEITLLVLVID